MTNESHVPPTSDHLSAAAPWWREGILALAVLLTALAAIKCDVADPDLWGHVEFGREVLRTGELPRNTTWSFTSHGRWVNHENLAEIALAWTFGIEADEESNERESGCRHWSTGGASIQRRGSRER